MRTPRDDLCWLVRLALLCSTVPHSELPMSLLNQTLGGIKSCPPHVSPFKDTLIRHDLEYDNWVRLKQQIVPIKYTPENSKVL